MNVSGLQDTNSMDNNQKRYLNELEKYFLNSIGNIHDKLDSFPKYITRSTMARFLARYEIFKKIIDIQGCVIECGVYLGGSLITWMQLSSILEPANHQRKIIGFDTFEGFPELTEEDKSKHSSILSDTGNLSVDSYEDIKQCIEIQDLTRYMNHIEKVELIKGNIINTVPLFIKENPHLIISLLYMDSDIFLPTYYSLKNFMQFIPRGGIIAFDELAQPLWPGETQGLIKSFGIEKFKINRFSFGTSISYIIKE